MGGDATISGNVIIHQDNLKISNLTVEGNVTISNKVKENLEFHKVTINGETIVEEEAKQIAKVATLAAVELPSTTLKITFNNSQVAYIRISRQDVGFNAQASVVEVLSVEADRAVIEATDNVLPNVNIFKGVTQIELNGTIKKIEIESNDELNITGKGNIEQVNIKTDKKVTLDTIGEIGKVSVKNEDKQLTLGKNVKVSELTTQSGEKVNPEKIIENYEEVKENVNVDLDEYEDEDYLAAKVIPVEGKYGYVKLSVVNDEGATIKYRQVSESQYDYKNIKPLAKVGEKAPADAKIYKGEEFIYWQNKNIEVYKVDKNDIITDVYMIDALNFHLPFIDVTIHDGKVIVKSIFDLPNDIETLDIFNGTNRLKVNPNTVNWTYGEDGLPTIEVPLNNFPYNPEEYTLTFNTTRSYRTLDIKNHNYETFPEVEMIQLKALNEFVSDADWKLYDYQISILLGWLYSEKNGTFHNSLSILFNEYVKRIKENPVSNAQELKDIINQVDEEYADLVKQYKETYDVVYSLYKDVYYWEFDESEQLADGITQEQINAAKEAVELLPNELEEKQRLLSDVNRAQRLFNQYVSKVDSTTSALDLDDVKGTVATSDSGYFTILESDVSPEISTTVTYQ